MEPVSAEKLHPLIAKIILDRRANARTAFYKHFASDIVFIAEGNTYGYDMFKQWCDYDIFFAWSSIMVANVMDGGLSVHLQFILHGKGGKIIQTANRILKFRITNDKVVQLEAIDPDDLPMRFTAMENEGK